MSAEGRTVSAAGTGCGLRDDVPNKGATRNDKACLGVVVPYWLLLQLRSSLRSLITIGENVMCSSISFSLVIFVPPAYCECLHLIIQNTIRQCAVLLQSYYTHFKG